jgi:hypothetical protein
MMLDLETCRLYTGQYQALPTKNLNSENISDCGHCYTNDTHARNRGSSIGIVTPCGLNCRSPVPSKSNIVSVHTCSPVNSEDSLGIRRLGHEAALTSSSKVGLKKDGAIPQLIMIFCFYRQHTNLYHWFNWFQFVSATCFDLSVLSSGSYHK